MKLVEVVLRGEKQGTIWFYTKPKGEPRPRVNFHTSRIISPSYRIKQTYKKLVQCEWIWEPDTEQGFEVNALFCFKKPESWTKKKKALMSDHLQVPDLDNLMKLYLDVCTGVIWHDDRQICMLSAKKIWGEKDSISLEILPKPQALGA